MARRKPAGKAASKTAGKAASKTAGKRPAAKRPRRRTMPVEIIDDPALPLLRGAAAEEFPRPRVDSGQVRWRPDTFKPGLAMDSHGDPVHNLVMRDAPPEAGQRVQRAMAAAVRQRQRTEKSEAARQRVLRGRELLAVVEARLTANEIELIDKRQRMLAALPDDVRETLALLSRDMGPMGPASTSPTDVALFVAEMPRMLQWSFEVGFVAAIERYQQWLTGNPEVDRILAGEAKRKSKLDAGRQTQSARKMERARKARAMYDEGVSVADIAKYFRDNEPAMKCNPETVRRWLREVMK
jgi:hypothetical protein